MYCNKCGKFIEYEGFVCKECLQKDQPTTDSTQVENTQNPEQVQIVQYQPEQVKVDMVKTDNTKPNPMMLGFKKALVSAILPEAAFIAAIFGLEMLIVNIGLIGSDSGPVLVPMLYFGGVFLFGALAISVLSMVMGIQSINVAKRAVAEGKRRPIPTFILGIVGTAMGGLMMFITIYFSFIAIGMSAVWLV